MKEDKLPDAEDNPVTRGDVLGHSLETILAAASSPEHSLASGSAAALSVALAAALAHAAADALELGDESSGYAVQAENLRLRAVSLVEQNRDRYEAARQALEARLKDPGYRDHRIGTAMRDTLETLGSIAGTGADTAELAANVAEVAIDELKPDAVAAATLAESGARVANILIGANLISGADSEEVRAAQTELAQAEKASHRACQAMD